MYTLKYFIDAGMTNILIWKERFAQYAVVCTDCGLVARLFYCVIYSPFSRCARPSTSADQCLCCFRCVGFTSYKLFLPTVFHARIAWLMESESPRTLKWVLHVVLFTLYCAVPSSGDDSALRMVKGSSMIRSSNVGPIYSHDCFGLRSHACANIVGDS